MKIFKIFILLLTLALTAPPAHSQVVTQAQWWFDDDYATTVQTTITSGYDYVWRKDIATDNLPAGLHRLNVRFKSSDGYWSGATSHWFVKLNRNADRNAYNSFEYWCENNFEGRRSISLGTNSDIQPTLNLPMEAVENGFHQLNFRVGYTNGYYSPVSTSYFFKYGNEMAQGNYIFEYWLDDDIQHAIQQQFASTEGVPSAFNINLKDAGLQENSLHRLSYCVKGIGSGVPQQSAVSTHYFFYHAQNANRLRYWFDSNTAAAKTVVLSGGENATFVNDISTAGLTNGIHTLNFCLQADNGVNGSTYTEYFEKGRNPYAPVFSEEQYVSDYVYWFDDNEAEKIAETVPLPHRQYYAYNKNLTLPDDVTRGNHTVNYRFRDNFGQWTETVRDTFQMLNGVLTANIYNLTPTINPYGHNVKKLSTIYRYYKIVDGLGNPIQGAVMDYSVLNRDANNTYWLDPVSQPTTEASDENGIMTLAFKTWGNNAAIDTDDAAKTKFNQLRFDKLRIGNKELKVEHNDFANNINVVVSDYLTDEYKLGLSIGTKATAGFDVPKFTDFKVGLSVGAKLSFTNNFEGDHLISRKYEFSADIKATGQGEIKIPSLYSIPAIPKLNGNINVNGELFGKFNMSKTVGLGLKPYLSVAYDVFTAVFQTDNTNQKLHEVLVAIGNYLLDEQTQTQVSGSMGFNFEAGFNRNDLEINFFAPSEFIKFNGEVSGKGGFEFGMGKTTSLNKTIKNTKFKYSFDREVSLGFKTNDNFGFSRNDTWASSIEYNNQVNAVTGEKDKVSIKFEKGKETELEADIDIWNVSAKGGKNYVYKYSLGKPIFDYLKALPNTISWTDATWKYWRTLSGIIPIGNSTERVENSLNDGIALLDYTLFPSLKDSYTQEVSKEYSVSAKISKRIGTPKWANWFGVDWSITVNAGVFMESKFPLLESNYNFDTEVILTF